MIYLDNNATTACDPLVIKKMLPYFNEYFGNPANGLHVQGQKAYQAIEDSRDNVAYLINAKSHEIFFTSGATESNNLAIQGICRAYKYKTRNRIITSAVEHKSVLNTFLKLREEEFEVIFLPVNSQCLVSMEFAKEFINENTLLVSIQAANNEIGTIQPISELSELAHQFGAYFHCDAAQAAGKLNIDVNQWDTDLLSLSAHKFYGPKGVGALFIKGGLETIPIEPIIFGGGQEHTLRSGTLNVPGIVGLSEASKLAKNNLIQESQRIKGLRDYLENSLFSNLDYSAINGNQTERIPNTISITFNEIEADALLLNCVNLMMATGSACSTGSIEPSHVLEAMGISRERAFQTIRISLGKFNTQDEVEKASKEIIDACRKIKSLS